MLDLQGIEDENERAKAMKRRIEEDRKKTLQVKEAEERADQKKKKTTEVTREVHQERQEEDGPPLSQKVIVQLLQVPHMNVDLILPHFLEEQNAIPPTSS
jgi:hypothetical protein